MQIGENVLLGSYEVLKVAYVACKGIYFEHVILLQQIALPYEHRVLLHVLSLVRSKEVMIP